MNVYKLGLSWVDNLRGDQVIVSSVALNNNDQKQQPFGEKGETHFSIMASPFVQVFQILFMIQGSLFGLSLNS